MCRGYCFYILESGQTYQATVWLCGTQSLQGRTHDEYLKITERIRKMRQRSGYRDFRAYPPNALQSSDPGNAFNLFLTLH